MSDHDWCRDVRRDEAVRAAEDAAAVPSIQHRDLPEVVAALTERVAKIEEAMMSGSTWYPICDTPAPPPPPAPPQPAPVPPAEGLRTERVTLEVTHRKHTAHEWAWTQMIWLDEIRGESVRVVEDDLPAVHDTDGDRVVMSWPQLAKCLTAERDAAIRERDAALADVAALQRERDDALLVLPACCGRLSDAAATVVQERGAAREECERLRARVAELEAAPPPRVKVPNLLQQNTWQSRDSQWIAAIRAAGGEVEG